jgi:drug/metabolite transporter (DMT)-like permease
MSAQMLLAGVVLLAAAAICGQWQAFAWRDVSTDSALALAYLVGVVTALTYPVYFWLLKVSTPAKVSTFAFVAPVVALTLGCLVLGETVSTAMLGAAALIVAGVVALTLGQRGG